MGEKWLILVKSGEKLVEKWRKSRGKVGKHVVKSWEMWGKVAKSGEKLEQEASRPDSSAV